MEIPKIRPTGKRVLAKEIVHEKIGSFILPEKTKWDIKLGLPRVWTVLAKGPSVCEDINIGDRIVTHSYTAGPQDVVEGYSLLTEAEIIAVMPGGVK